VFEKNTARCIENSLLDPAGVFAWRAAMTHSASPSPTFFLDGVRFHGPFAFHPAPLTKRDPRTFHA